MRPMHLSLDGSTPLQMPTRTSNVLVLVNMVYWVTLIKTASRNTTSRNYILTHPAKAFSTCLEPPSSNLGKHVQTVPFH